MNTCYACGTRLVPLGNVQVNGRYTNEEWICPKCFEQCPQCADWYTAGKGCPKHPETIMLTTPEQLAAVRKGD